ncbi:MAG TPA: ferritin family protein [Dissulfurispiraceae bacterium]|nr:ferritin family protein [Dissulfurispiraceae bacterium]
MERFSIREVIEQAVQTERLGHQFYSAMAQRFKDNERMSAFFTDLAHKEVVHEKTFADLRDLVGDSEPDGWEEVSQYMRAMVESKFFIGSNKALTSMETTTDIGEVIRFAIGFEKESLLYYYGIREAVKEKEIIDEIINEEKSHIRWLAAFRDSFMKKA